MVSEAYMCICTHMLDVFMYTDVLWTVYVSYSVELYGMCLDVYIYVCVCEYT